MPKMPKVPKMPKIVVRAFSTIDLTSNWQKHSFGANYQFWAKKLSSSYTELFLLFPLNVYRYR
jgi:hypothetical protein